MLRRPTREWLEVMVSGALLGGCAGSAAPPSSPPAPAATTSSATVTSPPLVTTAVPPPSLMATAEPPAPPVPLVQLPEFDGSACKGAVAARTEPACSDESEGEPPALSSLRAACAVDGLLTYRVERSRARTEGAEKATEVARSGEPCRAAADKESCEGRLKNVGFAAGGFAEPGGSRLFVVVSRGETLEVVANRAQLMALMGPVDSKHDASVLLWLEGWRDVCSKLQAQGSAFVVPKEEVGLRCPPMMGGGVGRASEQIPSVPNGYDKEGDYRLQIDRQGKLKVTFLAAAPSSGPRAACGRRPSGMALDGGCDERAGNVGAYLAECAELEAAAVIAFELLATELATHGAPAALVERCLTAAEDERRHTQLMSVAARRYGVEPTLPAPLTRPLPSLRELATENMVEGCVRETWGALSAALQARTARDPELAALYESIAPDELAHAELAWDLRDWLATRLEDVTFLEDIAVSARAELLAAQADAAPIVAELAGAPGREVARDLIRQLAA